MSFSSEFEQNSPEQSRRPLRPELCLEDGVINSYLRESLTADDLESVELHISFCRSCMERLETAREEREFAAVMRTALREVQRNPARGLIGKSRAVFAAGWRGWGLAAGAMLALVAFLALPRIGPPVRVDLMTLRGPGAANEAPAYRSLQLNPELRGLEPAVALRLEIVDAAGNPLTAQTAELTGPAVEWKPVRGLTPGQYWVRLSRADDPAALLREYPLRVVP